MTTEKRSETHDPKIKIGIQKSGRLTPETVTLLQKSGLEFDPTGDSRKLSVLCRNFDAELYFLRDGDIRQYVARAKVDLGIVGQNLLYECGSRNLTQLLELGFGKCSLAVAVPDESPYESIEDLNGKKIATSYPNSTRRFFKMHEIKTSIIPTQGSVEVAPRLGYADAISDIVSSGNTLRANGLRPLAQIYSSQAILIANQKMSKDKTEQTENLLVRFKGVIDAAKYKYLVMNAPYKSIDGISKAAHGLKSPTVTPLAIEGWVSVHVVIKETDFWDTIKALKALGVSGMVELPIERVIF